MGDAPTYKCTKQHILYTTATLQLKDGDFEGCLTTIETLMTATRALLDGNEVHEALAILYYLYGSTLLYAVEEAGDVMGSVPTMGDNGNGDGAVDANGMVDAQMQQAEDLQIAWENLDLARSIMEPMVLNISCDDDVKLDLAQVLTRLGDLQKANGTYAGAIEDFSKCLKLREPILGRFDRKVADCHYSIGTCCLLCASEGEKEKPSNMQEMPQPTGIEAIDNIMSAATAAANEDEAQAQTSTLTPEQISEYKDRGIMHYLACARSLAGFIQTLCGEPPTEDIDELDEKKQTKAGEQIKHSAAMNIIRERVKSLKAIEAVDEPKVLDLKDMLEEIQETIDTADETQQVMKDVSKMKAQAEAEADADSKPAAASESSPSTVIGFGAAAAATSAKAVNAPTMMIKSKKKRAAVSTTESGAVAKKSK